MRVLRILPRMIGGGPERGVLSIRRHLLESGKQWQEDLVVLDRPVAARMLLEARRLDIEIHIAPNPDQVSDLLRVADVIVIQYWNHPLLCELLERQTWPQSPTIFWLHVSGDSAPQVLCPRAAQIVDTFILPTADSQNVPGVVAAVQKGAAVNIVPSIADMRRLDGFAPRAHDGIVVGYIGSLDATKMHPRFLEMVAAVETPGVRFVIAGDAGQRAAMQARIDAMGLGETVTLLGHREDIGSVLEEVDIFGYPLAPTTFATTDKALQEAMWVGLPVVVMGPKALTGLVSNEVTGLVATDEASYVAAIQRLAGDSSERVRLGAAARDHARFAFDPSRSASAVWDAMERAGRKTPGARPINTHPPATGAALFAATLGENGADFTESLASAPSAVSAERRIAAASYQMAHGEGGLFHYRRQFPEDPFLHFWTSLILSNERRTEEATAEAKIAIRAGLEPARLLAHGLTVPG